MQLTVLFLRMRVRDLDSKLCLIWDATQGDRLVKQAQRPNTEPKLPGGWSWAVYPQSFPVTAVPSHGNPPVGRHIHRLPAQPQGPVCCMG